ncbi:MAG: isochorismatase family protein [Propionibacteriales bacterium]|nr:isochorismatase family protein [Propionibacteriales bacterium]
MPTALAVIDLQRQVIADAHDRGGVVARTAALVERARTEQVPVIWVQHNAAHLVRDSDGWQLANGLSPAADEPVVHKQYSDAFAETDLADALAKTDTDRLVIAGAASEQCVRATLHSAVIKGYDVVLVSDAHTTQDLVFDGHDLPATQLIDVINAIAQYGLVWPGASGSTATAATVDLTT